MLPLLETDLDALLTVLVDLVLDPLLVTLVLRPRCAYLPYPSCPVPADGPFRAVRLPSDDCASNSGLDFLVNSPNLRLLDELVGV